MAWVWTTLKSFSIIIDLWIRQWEFQSEIYLCGIETITIRRYEIRSLEFNQQFQVLIQDLIKIFNSEIGLNDIEFGCHYWYLKKNIEVLQ